jgi:hypothetical protein
VRVSGGLASEGFTGSLWQQRLSLNRLCSWRFSGDEQLLRLYQGSIKALLRLY